MSSAFTSAQWAIIRMLKTCICRLQGGGSVPIVVDNSLGDGSAEVGGNGTTAAPLFVDAIPPDTPDLAAVVAEGSNLPINSNIFFKDLDGTTNIGILRTVGTNTFSLFSSTGKTIVINPTNGEVRMVGAGGGGDTSTLSIELKLGVLPAGVNTPITAAMSWNQAIANLQAQIDALTP